MYVHSVLEYNSIIWSPRTKKEIDLIEMVQRRFTKRLHGFKSNVWSTIGASWYT